jgi:hypothetical protein
MKVSRKSSCGFIFVVELFFYHNPNIFVTQISVPYDNLRISPPPLTAQIGHSAGCMGGPCYFFIIGIIIFWSLRSQCKVSEPYPFWGFRLWGLFMQAICQKIVRTVNKYFFSFLSSTLALKLA